LYIYRYDNDCEGCVLIVNTVIASVETKSMAALADELFDFKDPAAVSELARVWGLMDTPLYWRRSLSGKFVGFRAEQNRSRKTLEADFRRELARRYHQHPASKWTKDEAYLRIGVLTSRYFPKEVY
jgi:hypothetical protein